MTSLTYSRVVLTGTAIHQLACGGIAEVAERRRAGFFILGHFMAQPFSGATKDVVRPAVVADVG